MKKLILLALTFCCLSLAAQELPSYDWANFNRYVAENEQLAETHPLAVLMGDSITDFWHQKDTAFFVSNNLVSRGISGQVTSQMLIRFRRDVLDLQPKYVILIGGINDIARNQGYISLQNTMGNLISMCELASAHGIEPVLCTIIPANKVVWRPAITNTREQVAELNAMIRAYASAQGLKLIDLEILLADENGNTRSDLSEDTIHPTMEGYKVFGTAILQALQPTVVQGSWDFSPALRSLETGTEPFVLNKKTALLFPEELQDAAGLLQELVEPMAQLSIGKGSHAIELALDDSLGEGLQEFQKAECYSLEVTADRVRIVGNSPLGVLHGVQTLVKALPSSLQPGEVAALPAGKVFDYPEFAYRAFMLDCARHFFPVSTVKKVIDILALHQMNYFHWHLSEDQGWRLEIMKYPKLTEVGSWRAGSPVRGQEGHDGVPVSGFYTQEEAREVVAYAARRGIEVIPEIDMPGHMKAALASYPELGCTGGPYEVACEYGVLEDVLCAGKPETLQFVCDVLDEVMDIFPSAFIHLGGDECPKVRWEACPHCQAKIRELGLKKQGAKTAEELLQSWFMDEVSAHLEAHGRRTIAWNDVLVGWDNIVCGAPSKKTVIAGWMRPVSSEIAVQEGYDAIFCPCGNLYLSAWDGNELTGEPYLRRVYDAQVIPGVLGVEACIWTERVDNEDLLLWELLPRLSAVSELQWTQDRNFDAFLPRLDRMKALYTARGWNWNQK